MPSLQNWACVSEWWPPFAQQCFLPHGRAIPFGLQSSTLILYTNCASHPASSRGAPLHHMTFASLVTFGVSRRRLRSCGGLIVRGAPKRPAHVGEQQHDVAGT
jgi:hypothetical protein